MPTKEALLTSIRNTEHFLRPDDGEQIPVDLKAIAVQFVVARVIEAAKAHASVTELRKALGTQTPTDKTHT